MAKTEVRPAEGTSHPNRDLILIDERGQPLTGRVPLVLRRLAPAFARQFAEFRDETLLVESLERAAYRILRRESQGGEVENLEAYAWVTLVSIANSLRRRGQARIDRRTTSELPTANLTLAASALGSAEQIERSILIRELLDHLSLTERLICEWRLEGLTSHEIAERRGCTAAAIDVLMTRVRRRLRLLLSSSVAVQRQAQALRRRETKKPRRRSMTRLPAAVYARPAKSVHLLEL